MQFTPLIALVAAAIGTNALRHGNGTHYNPGTTNACGQIIPPGEHIVAVSDKAFHLFPSPTPGPESNASKGNACGKRITAHHKGKTVKAFIFDKCEKCKENDLAFSPSAFKKLAPLNAEPIPINWEVD